MVLTLGGINKNTKEYIYPIIANKIDNYICPECEKDIILCKGKFIKPYFRHNIDNLPCNHYNNPTETQIHKDAKNLLKTLLLNKTHLSFIRKCNCCKNNEIFEIPNISEISKIILEYRFEFNGTKIADIAYIENSKIIYIFEICNTHRTCKDKRPEPWFEINAEKLIQLVNNNDKLSKLEIPCIREEKCKECIENDKNKIMNKELALNKLYDFLNKGIEIPPFYYHSLQFGEVKKNIKYNDQTFDLILYLIDGDDKYEFYYISIIDNNSNIYNFINEQNYASDNISIYYININWVLSQQTHPKVISYVASFDLYNNNLDYNDEKNLIKCEKCGWGRCPLWVKRTNTNSKYKCVFIGCGNCEYNSNSEYINCILCKKKESPLWVMETNINNRLCKSCDINAYSNIFLSVPFNDKDHAKKLGCKWNNYYKRWYTDRKNKNIDIILKQWTSI